VLPQRSRLGRAETLAPKAGEFGLNGWIKIGADGSVVLAMPRSEMGQGVHTALAMPAALGTGPPETCWLAGLRPLAVATHWFARVAVPGPADPGA